MAILTAAVIIVGVLCTADLLLTFGVIRRLREHTTLLSSQNGHGTEVVRLAVGQAPSAFTAVTTGGQQLTGPAGLRIVAFFSSTCSICPRRVPGFVDYLHAYHIRQADALAVVLAGPDEAVSYLDSLAEVATVCIQATDGELAMAFQVAGYPAFCLLDETGAVLATSFDPAQLPELVAA
jgi:hypothetical protein